MTRIVRYALVLAFAMVLCGVGETSAHAGDRLQWTGAVTDVEGASGGGIVPWALIGGLETNEQLGATGFATYVFTQDFSLRSAGASVDVYDRVEISWARQRFDVGSVVPGVTLGQDIVSAKIRVLGDAVFAPDSFLPQVAFGAEWKRTLDFDEIPRAVGAAHGEDVDLYVAATKLYFAAIAGRNVILDATVRRTRANQFGLLGFGSQAPGEDHYHYMPEVSAGIFVADPLLFGVEYRDKPNILGCLSRKCGGRCIPRLEPAQELFAHCGVGGFRQHCGQDHAAWCLCVFVDRDMTMRPGAIPYHRRFHAYRTPRQSLLKLRTKASVGWGRPRDS